MELPDDPRVREALGIAMTSLVAKARLSGEISRNLISKGYSELEVEAVLEHLSKHLLIDDDRTIQELLESRTGKRSAGPEKLRAELRRRGASEEQIEEALASRTTEDELSAMFLALQSKRWPEQSENRAARFLISRGFDEELIPAAIETFFDKVPE